ncbi:MAG: trypsin-like peptidase domain-containing protein [Chloroflexi bacterium]|nr:trypsin-like peptidase domain-containing protein [Chloroflexota bacterium]
MVIFAAAVLVAALIAGAAGAVAALRLVAPAPLVAAVPTAPASTGIDRAIVVERVTPGIVTVLADLPPRTNAQGQRVETENIGSAIVIHEAGLILTNYHVVAGAARLTVVLSTGERRPAQFVADDSPFNDMALLRVQAGGLRAVALGDSDALRPGDPLTVISSGLVTFDNQVKAGVVSAVHLDFPRPGVVLQDMVQTDAAVNHGDSGGALLNARGEVVGLVTTVVRHNPAGESVEGVGLAHSINSLRPVLDAVIATGVSPRPRLGIERLGTQHTPINRSTLPAGSPYADGVAIVAVDRGSAAEAAGIRVGDVVTAVNGQQIESLAPFVNLLGVSPAGRDVQLTVFRDGRQRAVIVSPRPAGPGR